METYNAMQYNDGREMHKYTFLRTELKVQNTNWTCMERLSFWHPMATAGHNTFTNQIIRWDLDSADAGFNV